MKTIKIILLPLIITGLIIMTGCMDSDDDGDDLGNWIRYSDFEGVTRSGAIGFVIGEYAYVGLGSDGDNYLKDLWRYDPSKNFWQEMSSFPGTGRISAVAFSVDGKGYVGTGYNENLTEEELADFWEYDPSTNSWTEKAAYAGGSRYSAVGFSLSGKGYIGTGYNGNYLKDFWSYDPAADTWSQTTSIFGSKRESAISFVLDGKAYVGTGRNNGSYLYDFWAYDPAADSWEDLTLYDEDDYFDEYLSAISRYGAVAFTMDGKGYIAVGIASSYMNTVYSYDPATGEWDDEINVFEGSARSATVAFTINNTAYICTGRNSSQRFDDIWGFYPLEEYNQYD